jgi:HSP20 family protein
MATMTTSTPTPATATPARRETVDRALGTIAPRVDIFETEKSFVLLADMPGVAPDGLEVIAERGDLVVRGRVEPPAATPDYQDFELANYYRAFTLTEDLDTAGITAVLRDGVLRLEIPKSPRLQPKKIPVRTE